MDAVLEHSLYGEMQLMVLSSS